MNGLGITIIVGQLPKLFGFSTDADRFLDEVKQFVENLDETDTTTLLVGVAVLAVLLVLPAITTRLPAMLVAVVGATVVSAVLGLADEGVATVGALPQGVPAPTIPWTSAERRRPAAHRRARHHARVADRHDRHGDELRRPAGRRGRARPGDGRHGRGERRRRALPGLRRVDQRLTYRGGRAVGRQEPGSPASSAPGWSWCSCCS